MAKDKDDPRAASAVDRAIGVRIRTRRLDMGMSQTSLAEAIGVTFQQIQKYEKGINRVSASTLLDIARSLKAPVTALLPVSTEAAEASDDPVALELAPLMSQLNAEGRRMLLKVARGLAGDNSLRKPPKRRD